MNIKFQAAARTAGFFAVAITAPWLVITFLQLAPHAFMWVCIAGVIALLIWAMYSTILNQLVLEKKINESFERIKEVTQKY